MKKAERTIQYHLGQNFFKNGRTILSCVQEGDKYRVVIQSNTYKKTPILYDLIISDTAVKYDNIDVCSKQVGVDLSAMKEIERFQALKKMDNKSRIKTLLQRASFKNFYNTVNSHLGVVHIQPEECYTQTFGRAAQYRKNFTTYTITTKKETFKIKIDFVFWIVSPLAEESKKWSSIEQNDSRVLKFINKIKMDSETSNPSLSDLCSYIRNLSKQIVAHNQSLGYISNYSNITQNIQIKNNMVAIFNEARNKELNPIDEENMNIIQSIIDAVDATIRNQKTVLKEEIEKL